MTPAESTASSVRIPEGSDRIVADLEVPGSPQGLVIFAHGSGSGRHSPRNRWVAAELRSAGFATMLLDLLTTQEARLDERTREFRFDIPRLARRLRAAIDWTALDPNVSALGIGLFGASTGGAAALIAAGDRAASVRAVVLRGARSDLADDVAGRVEAPTLFLVGELDVEILELNRATSRLLSGLRSTVIVPKATHLFEEPGALETVARETVRWFRRHLAPGPSPVP